MFYDQRHFEGEVPEVAIIFDGRGGVVPAGRGGADGVHTFRRAWWNGTS